MPYDATGRYVPEGGGGTVQFEKNGQKTNPATQPPAGDPQSALRNEILAILPLITRMTLGPAGVSIAQSSNQIREAIGSRLARSGIGQSGGSGVSAGLGNLAYAAGQGSAAAQGAQLRNAISQMATQLAAEELGQRRNVQIAKIQAAAQRKAQGGGFLGFLGKFLSPFTMGLSDLIFNLGEGE